MITWDPEEVERYQLAEDYALGLIDGTQLYLAVCEIEGYYRDERHRGSWGMGLAWITKKTMEEFRTPVWDDGRVAFYALHSIAPDVAARIDGTELDPRGKGEDALEEFFDFLAEEGAGVE